MNHPRRNRRRTSSSTMAGAINSTAPAPRFRVANSPSATTFFNLPDTETWHSAASTNATNAQRSDLMRWSHFNPLPTWTIGLALSCCACNSDPQGSSEKGSFSSKPLYLEISEDRRSVIVATPAGSLTIFNVIDACVEGGEPPVVDGFYLGGEYPLAVKYSGSCVASLNLEEKDVTCVACD